MMLTTITVFATKYDKINSTTILSKDGSGFTLYENGTEWHFAHNITGPEYLYENDTIYHSSNLSEVFAD
jgi:hypothetical protein